MYFELQISAQAFTSIVRDRLKALSLCDSLDAESFDKQGTLLVVDQIVIEASTTIQREPQDPLTHRGTQKMWIFSLQNFSEVTVQFLQVKQLISIRMVKPADLEANGPNPTKPYNTVPISPVYNLSLTTTNQTQGGGPVTLTYTLAYVDFGLLHDEYTEEQRQNIRQAIAGVTIEPITIDLKALEQLLNRPVAALNAGIACGPDNELVALRVDFDVKDAPGGVTQEFFEHGPPNRLAGKDWAMFVDSATFTLDAKEKARAALQKKPLEMKLLSGPDASWAPGAPGVFISAERV